VERLVRGTEDDDSSRPPSDAALAQSGVQFVCRYLSHPRSKNLTAREAQHMSSLGISLVVVWETSARPPLSGQAPVPAVTSSP
jgi:Domain of unknown function (DUF1906)